MPKWKKGATEFTVGINYHKKRGYQTTIPKPIIEFLNNPQRITFVIDEKRVEITAEEPNPARGA